MTEKSEKAYNRKLHERLFNMVSVGVVDDRLNQGYDVISTLLLVINLVVSFAMTFDGFYAAHYGVMRFLEAFTVTFFALDYFLRLITSDLLFPNMTKGQAARAYIFSGYGIIDLLSFLPYYLPFFFPTGAAVFRMFRVIRIFRLFRVNAYSDSLTLIGRVLTKKKTQLYASLFIIFMLILASSLCMYSVEHNAQPDVFANAFSGMWWATSTLLTVGYGDIYPVTTAGKIIGIIITFLGVGLVAIPTGIISAGFVEEYQRAKTLQEIGDDEQIRFIEMHLGPDDKWTGKKVAEIGMPHGSIIAAIIRGDTTVIPRGNVTLRSGDRLIICAQMVRDDYLINLHEIELKHNHSWNGLKVKELDISRQTFIVLVERNDRMILPEGNLTLKEGDKVLLYTKEKLSKYTEEALF